MNDYALSNRAAKGAVTPAPAAPNGHCCVAGCQMPGTMTHSTTGSSEWYCRLHFGVEFPGRASVTSKANNRAGLVRLALRCANAPTGARVPRQIEALMAQLGRQDLLDQARALQPEVPLTGRALGRYILAALDSECAADEVSQGTSTRSKDGDEWFRAADVLPAQVAA